MTFDFEHHDNPSISPEETRRRQAEYVANVGLHAEVARHQIKTLVERTRVLVRNGIDLRNPEAFTHFAEDQVREAVVASTVPTCHCEGSEGAAAVALIAELARQLAEVTR